MKRKRNKYRVQSPAGGFDHVSSSSEFYSSSPVEKPLSDRNAPSDAHDVRRTGRHQIVSGRPVERMDPREKMALMAILRAAVLVLSLMIAFFMLWKGIKLYEESIWIGNAETEEKNPIMQPMEMVEAFNIEDQNSREQFVTRIGHWKEAERLVRSADILIQRNIQDQAIKQCQDALRHDPAHLGALERLGQLYFAQGEYVEAVNAYIRVLSVDPSKKEIQRRLIEALDQFGDYDAVTYMAQWYLSENSSDHEIARWLANAQFAREDYAEAAAAYERVLREFPDDVKALEKQADAYIKLQQYKQALVPLATLRELNTRNPLYYRQTAVCQAQLEMPRETVQTLIRVGQLFGGDQMVLRMVQDPMLDPVREERIFQAYVTRLGGNEFRLRVEEQARQSADDNAERAKIEPTEMVPGSEILNPDLLQLEP